MSKQQVETWTYAQITDINFINQIGETICDESGHVRLQMSDGVIEVSKRQAFLNLPWFQIPLAFGIPVSKRHFVKRTSLNGGSHAEVLTRYYDEIMNLDPHNAKKLKQVLWKYGYTVPYRVACETLLPYSSTFDMIGMAKIIKDPKMDPIIKTRDKITPLMSSREVEKVIKVHSDEIMDLLNQKDGVQEKMLYGYRRVKQLNPFQVPQTIYAFGMRTDVNDNIVRYPVKASALSGLNNIMEYAVESLSAKKAMFYSHIAVSDSQYFGRKQHLISSTIRKIYRGDCGSTQLVPFDVTENNCNHLVGKLIYVTDHYEWITQSSAKNYIGQKVMMRSALTCKHTDGVCEACAGRVIQNVNRKLNIGILSAMHMIEPVTQGILSAKHLIKTKSLEHVLSPAATKLLYHNTANEISWLPIVLEKLRCTKLGIPSKYFQKLGDVIYIRQGRPVKETDFSNVVTAYFKNRGGKITELPLEYRGQVPYLSTEMLTYVRDHFNDVVIEDEIVWIPLEETMRFPIFRVMIVNDNLLDFVKKVSVFLSKDIKDYTSCAIVLKDFTDLLYSKVGINIAHVEIVLKAYMIESENNYCVPVVKDQNDVHFQTLASILTNRHIGTCLAYEGLSKYVISPSTYLSVKQGNPFDLLLGYTSY